MAADKGHGIVSPHDREHHSGDPQNSLLDRISQHLDEISPSERKVADLILLDPVAFTTMTMARAAGAAGVSEPTVMRLALSLGCDGFQSLKMALAQAVALGMPVTFSAINDTDSVADIARKVFDHTITSLDKARHALDVSAIERSVELILAAPTVVFVGFGASSIIALDAAQKIPVFGRPLLAPSDPHQAFMAIATVPPPSVVVAISNSGRTTDAIRLAEVAKSRSLPVIAITGSDDTPLSAVADVPIVVRTFENTDVYTPAVSRIAGLAVVDIIAAALAIRRGDQHHEGFRAMKASLLEFRSQP
ncbi:MurR/RpiR family transcriptional regulator [Microbacterium sp. zg.B48]|uniref:MurR/RpiR family transcriptional regulator n=1 Tax=unclassified Microbacterium TaxID=2609290 RepID=UPI00214B35CA|nr:MULTISPECIES: MurR/RpiR family transcriptional regulator [unclassified Microbacterium]MCR2762815.1 MurR/RpiR family transcriptional regulator [Microbacterium sp. zg.B48]MCR2808378.1 MurR/RpiR family transcriptional regulator [Microbacterium sp. zg.B185]WIM19176.1 MurR/RpiR family transcriptional regulator [Microbacterium sp. zg-B185]